MRFRDVSSTTRTGKRPVGRLWFSLGVFAAVSVLLGLAEAGAAFEPDAPSLICEADGTWTEPDGYDSSVSDSDGDGILDVVEFENSAAATAYDPVAYPASPLASDPCDATSYFYAPCFGHLTPLSNEGWDYSYNAAANDSDSGGVFDLAELFAGTDPCDQSTIVCDQEVLGDDLSELDSDGDGVTDLDEIAAGTDPCVVDAIVCGEVVIGYDPLTADTDGDGVGDFEETDTGTDPCVPNLVCGTFVAVYDPQTADSDDDGVSDADEVAYGSDPCDESDTAALTVVCGAELFGYDSATADSDMDGATDAEELAAGTDPCVVEVDLVLVCGVEVEAYDASVTDSDSDGATDAAETAAGTDPCVAETLVCGVNVASYDSTTYDADGDTVTDAAEIAAGSNPCVKDTLPFTGFDPSIIFFALTALILGTTMKRMGDTQIRFNN